MNKIKSIGVSVLSILLAGNSAMSINASAEETDHKTVYMTCVEEHHYIENGIEVHEYLWGDPSFDLNNIAGIKSGIDDASWVMHDLEDGNVLYHRAAKEYHVDLDTHNYVWDAHAQTKTYNFSGTPVQNRSTAQIVKWFWGTVVDSDTSSFSYSQTDAQTDSGALASEPTLVLRSYWQTQ
jgi:hypothetical protein